MKKFAASIVAAGASALLLAGCVPSTSEPAAAEPTTVAAPAVATPEPVQTPAYTPPPAPEPTPAPIDTNSPALQRLAIEMAWSKYDADEQQMMCSAISVYGIEWAVEQFDPATNGFDAQIVRDFFSEKCGI